MHAFFDVANSKRQNSHITKLHDELRDVRRAYLSTAQPRKSHFRAGQPQQRHLTDKERENIDNDAKKMLRELNSGILILQDKEAKRRDDEERMIRKTYGSGLGALGSWAAGGRKTEEHEAAEERARGIEEHREGVIWFLRKQLQLCASTQQVMMEARLKREMEKSRSVLANATVPITATKLTGGKPNESHPNREPSSEHNEELTDEQIQMFEKGNQDMMSHYQNQLEQVK